jgi:hypothetical protein
MPQFDIFSFFSQLFWVFLGFILLYLSISLYILPSIAAILKVRKRKLAQISTTNVTSLQVFSTSINDVASTNLFKFNGKLVSANSNLADLISSAQSGYLKSKTQAISVKAENFLDLNFKLLNQAQLCALLYA